jgi:anti-sigma factor RsiW
VTEYLDGALDASTRARLEAHLAACGGCERYLEQLRQTVRLAGLLLAVG